MEDQVYTNHWEPGTYTCSECGQTLFSSQDKFHSGTRWPSFRKAAPGAVETRPDHSLDMERTEVLCSKCEQHLGHVFEDGKVLGDAHAEAGLRYCILSEALDFRPAASGESAAAS